MRISARHHRINFRSLPAKLVLLQSASTVSCVIWYFVFFIRQSFNRQHGPFQHIQRRATKIIPELRDLSYEERLKECGLTTLETRRLRGDQIEVFKILNGYENIDRNMFFSLKKDSRTRGHEVKLVKDQCRLDIRKHSFSQRTINEWNKLSTDCVTASSVNMFKNKVDTYLRRAGYK